MLRKLGIFGLGVPLVAIIAALVYLFLFGTSEPTFDAATRDLARDHTVLRLDEDPPAAMIVPDDPPKSAILVIILPDDERHVWSVVRALGLLEHVNRAGLALIPVTGSAGSDRLADLTGLASDYVAVSERYIAAFSGEPLRSLCGRDGLSEDGWSGAVIVGRSLTPPTQCGDLPMLQITDEAAPGARIVQWMLERR